MNSILKLNKKQEHKNSFNKKLLREYITFQLENSNLIHPYTDLEEYPLS